MLSRSGRTLPLLFHIGQGFGGRGTNVSRIHSFRTYSVSNIFYRSMRRGSLRSFCSAADPALHIRNIAVIAHVDHGKTTLVDKLLKAGQEDVSSERVMDSHDLEAERGITILSKCTSFCYKDYTINLVDTPGHADFGGEVERVLDMVDGVLLLVDATEGPMTQTRFVLRKALEAGLRPIVVLNKVDRAPSLDRVKMAETEVFDLFDSLGASDEQLDFTTLYASARDGWATGTLESLDSGAQCMTDLLDAIVKHVNHPSTSNDDEFAMLVSITEADRYYGKLLTGRIESGSVQPGLQVRTLAMNSADFVDSRVLKVFKRRGTKWLEVESANAGDIVTIAGPSETVVSNTIVARPAAGAESHRAAIQARAVDPPVVGVTLSTNTSPLRGRDGDKVTLSKIGERLLKEAESNVSIRVKKSDEPGGGYLVEGRGEMQLGVLIETMRREGFELEVSAPQVLYQYKEDGSRLEPIEDVDIEVDTDHVGWVLEQLTQRHANVVEVVDCGLNRSRILLTAPSRALIGFRNPFTSVTKGSGILRHSFKEYGPHCGSMPSLKPSAMVATASGTATLYGIDLMNPKGPVFVEPGAEVYEGMIVGELARAPPGGGDMDVNPAKTKHLSNVRSTTKEEKYDISPPRTFAIDEALAYIGSDECIEVTPATLRMRKTVLPKGERARIQRKNRK
eukprot:Rmarinus@m.17473